MAHQVFKTNIKCAACVEKVREALDETVGKNQWEIDLQNPDRLLQVPQEVQVPQLIAALKAVGYGAEKIQG